MRKTTLALTLLVFGLLAQPSEASIVTVLDSGDFGVGLVLTPDLTTIQSTDFRASALLGVVDTSGPSVLSFLLATDVGNPAPNYIVNLLNLAATELGVLTFLPGTGAINGNFYTVDALFANAGPVTDPGLQALAGILSATFHLTQAVDLGNAIVAVYTLDALVKQDTTPVPEPSTCAALGAGLSGLLFAVRRRRNRLQN